MPLTSDAYRYVKAAPTNGFPAAPQAEKSRLMPGILITIGSLIIANVAWPIVTYQLFTAPKIQKTQYIWPISQTTVSQIENSSIPNATNPTNPQQVLGAQLDYTNPKTWFPQAPFQANNQQGFYSISIPSLDIFDAKVIVGGEDLNQSLIQYPGTSIPGQPGSPVIFGHSILRQFYNPSIENKDRYVSIFSTIMTLKNSDRIYVDYDGIRYTYEVKDKVEVQPDDLFILEQRYNNRELKLITCTPEGTYLRRGVVIAQLVNLSDPTHNRR